MFKFKSSILALLVLLLHSYNGNSQQLQMTDFVLFGGNGTLTGCTNPSSPGAAVQIGSSASIQGGSIGSYTLIKTTGSALITGNIHSGKTIVLANSNQVNGKISAANSSNSSSTILSVGSSALLKDSINVKGSIVVSGGTVILPVQLTRVRFPGVATSPELHLFQHCRQCRQSQFFQRLAQQISQLHNRLIRVLTRTCY